MAKRISINTPATNDNAVLGFINIRIKGRALGSVYVRDDAVGSQVAKYLENGDLEKLVEILEFDYRANVKADFDLGL